MLKRRHVLTGMTAAAAATTLAACGGRKADGSAGSDAGGDATLTYLHRLPDGDGMTPVSEIVERWNKENPDLKVKATKFDGKAAEMAVRLENDIKAGTGPDLAQIGYAEVPALFTKGLLEDVAKHASSYTKDFASGPTALMKIGEAVVGLPQDSGPLVYFYNASEFERLGLSVPTTRDELVSVAQAAASQGKLALSFQPDEAQFALAGQAAAAGAVWYKPEKDAWRVEVDSPETQKVADMWQAVLDAKAALTEERWGDGFTAALTEQRLIGTIGAAWEAALLADAMKGSPNEGQWKVAPMPALGDAPLTGPDGGSGLGVMKGSKNPEGAMKFAAWFNTQVEDLATQGLVVAATAAVETPEALKTFFGGQDVMAELAKANESMNTDFIYVPTWSSLADPMSKGAAAAADGSGKVADIFTAAQTESIASLKSAGLPVAE